MVSSLTKKNLVTNENSYAIPSHSFVGAASFELPWAFTHKVDLWDLTVGVLFLALLSMFSLDRLSRCSVLTADKNGRTKTFPEIGRAAYGKTGYVMAWFGMIAMSLGVTGSVILFFISSTLVELTGWPKTVDEDPAPPPLTQLNGLSSSYL